ncbi:MAG: type II toxin-antitoxin system RatA family toxin [Gammaproteobacteria bacterium]|nr:type II toxin-antitoxin system RatA family toxin [Gammaproteobacteria bacterium]
MTIIKRSALVGYSARQMFELVNNVDDYPRFLPWCSESHIITNKTDEIEAELTISWAGMNKSFITRNSLQPYERMDITLVSGPFHKLQGHWQFLALNHKACKVCLELEFEFAGSMLDKVFQPIFNHIANTLVDSFCKRAVTIYGQS